MLKMESPPKKSCGHHCYFCGERLPNKNELRKHIRKLHTEREHICTICEKGFTAKFSLIKHQMIHTGERPYLCELCGKSFTTKGNFQRHMDCAHSLNNPFVCKSCGKRLTSYAFMKCGMCRYRELGTETESNTVGENNCEGVENFGKMKENNGKSLVITNEFEETENRSPETTDKKNKSPENIILLYAATAPYGDIVKIYTLSSTLQADSKKFFCNLCNTSYPNLTLLQEHSLSHRCELPFPCDKCNLKFRTIKNLRAHFITHSDLRPHKCPTCGMEFKRTQTMRRHMQTHEDERPYACQICKKTYKQLINLKNHLLCHSDERPYKCKHCGSTYKFQSSMLVHVRTHNRDLNKARGQNSWRCEMCNETFDFKKQLRLHARIHLKKKTLPMCVMRQVLSTLSCSSCPSNGTEKINPD